MYVPIREVYQCPFCNLESSIAINSDALLEAASRGSRFLKIDLSKLGSQKIVVYNPGTEIPGPCRHVIDLWIDGMTSRTTPTGIYKRGPEFTATWRHDWFGKNDPDNFYNIFLWETVIDEEESQFHPTSEFDVAPLCPSWMVPGPWELEISGFVIAARRPAEFLAQLPCCYRRQQKIWEKEPAETKR